MLVLDPDTTWPNVTVALDVAPMIALHFIGALAATVVVRENVLAITAELAGTPSWKKSISIPTVPALGGKQFSALS
jgi:hypothetical protein